MMVENIDASVELLAMVAPDVIVIAHTATSYHLGRQREADLLDRLQSAASCRVITAFGSVLQALQRLDVRRIALGTPYSPETTAQGKAHLEARASRSSISPISRASKTSTTRLPNGPTSSPGPSTGMMPRPCFSAAPACRHCRYCSCSSRISASR